MARRRYISTTISVDKAINQLAIDGGDFAVMLYTWMIPHAGDDGCLTGDPDEILMTVIPGRRDKDCEDVAEALAAMVRCQLIEWDKQTVRFPPESFYRYQTYIKPENRRQSPDASIESADTDATAANSDEQRKTPQKAASVSPSFSPSVSSPVTPPSTASDDAVEIAANAATDAPREVRPVPKPKTKPREPNVWWDTQVEIFGYSPTPDTPEHGRWQASTAIWRKLNASPDDMRLAADLYRQEFPHMAFTVNAVAGRAEQLLKGHKPNPPPRPEDIKNPMVRSAMTADLSDITDELESQHGPRRHLPTQNGRSGELFSDPRRLGAGERPPQPDVLPAPRRSGR